MSSTCRCASCRVRTPGRSRMSPSDASASIASLSRMPVAVPVAIVLAMVRQGAGLPLLLASLTGWFILAAIDQRIPLTEICAASIGLARLWYPPIGGTGPSALPLLVLAAFAEGLALIAPLLTQPGKDGWATDPAPWRLPALRV